VTLGSLLADLTPQERSRLDLRVYIANTNPKDHVLYQSAPLVHANSVITLAEALSRSIPKLDAVSSLSIQSLRDLESTRSYRQKAALDFAVGLNYCYHNSTAPYIALFEDDILAADGWFAKAHMSIRTANEDAKQRGKALLDLRLFNDAREIRWTGNRFGRSNMPTLILWAPALVIMLSGSTFALLSCLQKKTNSKHPLLSRQAIRTICYVTIPVLVFLWLKTGRFALIPRPEGVSVQPWGCCTQGEIFPRSQIPALVRQLVERSNRSAADITDWDHGYEQGLLRYVLDPPMVQHLGFSSILDPEKTTEETLYPFNPRFEDLDETKLAEDHVPMVQELNG